MEENTSTNQKTNAHDEKKPYLPPAKYDKSEQWVQEHKDQFGTEPSFF